MPDTFLHHAILDGGSFPLFTSSATGFQCNASRCSLAYSSKGSQHSSDSIVKALPVCPHGLTIHIILLLPDGPIVEVLAGPHPLAEGHSLW